MTNLLVFPFDRVRRNPPGELSSSAQIIIYTGVSIERRDFTIDALGAKRKPRRRSRQQAVRFKED